MKFEILSWNSAFHAFMQSNITCNSLNRYLLNDAKRNSWSLATAHSICWIMNQIEGCKSLNRYLLNDAEHITQIRFEAFMHIKHILMIQNLATNQLIKIYLLNNESNNKLQFNRLSFAKWCGHISQISFEAS